MLEISLLGEIVVRLHGQPISRFDSKKEIALLAYLAHTGQKHSREMVADLLWEARSTKQSLSNLRTIIARLRKQIGNQLVVTRHTVGIATAVHDQTDSNRFQAMLAGVGQDWSVTAINLLAQGLALYTGEFMDGFYLPGTPRFNDWLVVEQERLRQIAQRGYQQLAAWQEAQGAFAAGVQTAQRWANWDPLDEAAQQQLMRLLAFSGRSAEATAVYQTYQQLLQTELAIPPAAATTALYEAIQAGSLTPPAPLPQHNLPRALKPLYGRQKEIEQLTDTLRNPDYPLISVTGVGGIGKTSLALAAGRQLLTEEPNPFKDGIWFISLEEIENNSIAIVRDEVAALIGQAIGCYFHGESDLWSQLLGQLAAKHLLLILDNIEQILPVASDLIVALLAAGDNIQLLVTSHTSLALAANKAFPLTGLETPTQVSAEALHNESVQLFAERAARIATPFQLEKDLAEVVAICKFVQGLPLAIELAAASLGQLLVGEILPALTSNLHLLNTIQPDLPPRQRTLQAVFNYSWQLLDANEQILLAQISVFRGGFTRRAAAAVLDGAKVNSGLYHLQHHALLNRDETGRFRMHPLLRQLAHEKLSDPNMSEKGSQTLNRHGHYFAQFMHSFEHDLRLGVSQAALQSILPDQANLRAAWQRAVQAGQWQIVSNCLAGLHFFYKRTGLFNEEAVLVDSALTTLAATMDASDKTLTSLLSRLLTARAWIYLKSAEHEIGLKTAERACELAQRVKDALLEGQARLVWAKLLAQQHTRKLALAQYEQVVALAKTTQNQILEADGWIGIGEQKVWLAGGKLAPEPLQHALDLCRKLQYKLGEMETLIFLGASAISKGDFAQAIDYSKRSLQISRHLGDVAAEAEALGSLCVVLAGQGDLAGSQICGEEALAIFRQLNMPESEQWILGQLGLTAIQIGDYAAAEKQLIKALAITEQLKDTFWQAWVKLRLGAMWNERGESEKAVLFLTEAFQTVEQLKHISLQARALYDWGDALLNQEDWVNAALKFQKAHDLWQERGMTEYVMLALAGMAYVAYQQGMSESAAAHAEQLWQTWQASPSMAERANLKAYWMLGMVWQGLGDSRANDLWKKAHALLQKRCEKIPDERLRKTFLEQVPIHRAILSVPG